MKRIVAIIALLSLCSCGSQPSESPAVQSEPETTIETTTIEATTVEEVTTLTETTTTEVSSIIETTSFEESTNDTKSQKEQEIEDFISQYDYFKQYDYEEPFKAYEDDNISVTADWWVVADYTFSIRLIIENKTDKDIIIKSSNSSINDFDIALNIYDRIAAGKKKILFAENKPNELQRCMQGKEIEYIQLRLEGLDENSYSQIFKTDVITIPIEQ